MSHHLMSLHCQQFNTNLSLGTKSLCTSIYACHHTNAILQNVAIKICKSYVSLPKTLKTEGTAQSKSHITTVGA